MISGTTRIADETHDGQSVAIPVGDSASDQPLSGEEIRLRFLDIQGRLAAEHVRRYANQHQCRQSSTGAPCAHPDHRRDVHYAHHLLGALDLPHERTGPIPLAERMMHRDGMPSPAPTMADAETLLPTWK